MTVEPLVPDVAPAYSPAPQADDAGVFAAALDGLGDTLAAAQRGEDAFAAGAGTLHDAVYERARASVAIAVASAAAQRAAQALSSLLNIQV